MTRLRTPYPWAAALIAALLLALMPAAGHALQLCVCPDGNVSIDTACEPQSCCDDPASSPVTAVPVSADPESQCTSLPLLPESEPSAQSVAPAGPRVNAPVVADGAPWFVQTHLTLSHHPPGLPDTHRPLSDPAHTIRTTVLLV